MAAARWPPEDTDVATTMNKRACAHKAGERNAVAVDPAVKTANLTRLRRVGGQVRGIQKMVDGERYCADILTQLGAIHEALRSVGRELLRNHCTTARRRPSVRAVRTLKRCTTSSSSSCTRTPARRRAA